ncbi:MAG: DNA topoisomerase, partial [Candidatus Omnitrophica bacterium]|nr:DNA topoisomerase [Candidatus Omnitrophota bacterium]
MKAKNLIIVESPTKAKTISKIMGDGFTVISSMGHILDLPAKKLGVDIEGGFTPAYTVISGRKKILDNIKKEAGNKDKVYVATDPDREGEAIGWQIKERILKDKDVLRVTFHEITPSAITAAFKNPRSFDTRMVEAQISRRVLDRIVGYFLSPLLWRKINRGLSAGRVQSVALRLVVERERQIQKFIPQEYWEIEAQLHHEGSQPVTAKLEKIGQEKAKIPNKEAADKIVNDIQGKRFQVAAVNESEKKRYPDPPFITSTLQQEAFNKLRFNATKTMMIAQQLYEGVDLGKDAPIGLITYMRTDSTRVANEAIAEARNYISQYLGQEYLPEKPNIYKVKKIAQEA